MQLNELVWERDNPPGYVADRFISQWLMPTIRHPNYQPPASPPDELRGDLFEGIMERAPDYLEYNYYRIVERWPPHVRAGKWEVRCHSAIGSPIPQKVIHFNTEQSEQNALNVACFIAHLSPAPLPKELHKTLLQRIKAWLSL